MSEEFKHSNELKDIKKISTLAADHLFEENPCHNKLGDNQREEFHTLVALFFSCVK